ncbi:MAG: orotidine-5'-phosphate decarboxylase [Limnochordia bacterium]|jgi:orotidine-5'-phosphate decarboxylase
MINFADRLSAAIEAKNSRVVVGLDPHGDLLPHHLLRQGEETRGTGPAGVAWAIARFNREIIDAVADHVVAVKPQLAFYERWGSLGIAALEETITAAREAGLLVIMDGKRNDIGSTAQAYAESYLGDGPLGSDALTINAYLGRDGVAPFLKDQQRGVFALVKTSNPSGGDLQDLDVDGRPLYYRVAELLTQWGAGAEGRCGYQNIGFVVGATYPEVLAQLRQAFPHNYFLIPGYGHQGGGVEDILPAFDDHGTGAVVNSSRGILFAYGQGGREEDFAGAAQRAAQQMQEEINEGLGL